MRLTFQITFQRRASQQLFAHASMESTCLGSWIGDILKFTVEKNQTNILSTPQWKVLAQDGQRHFRIQSREKPHKYSAHASMKSTCLGYWVRYILKHTQCRKVKQMFRPRLNVKYLLWIGQINNNSARSKIQSKVLNKQILPRPKWKVQPQVWLSN